MVYSHFRQFKTPGIKFLGKNTSETVYFKKMLTKMHIFEINLHLKVEESWNFFEVPPIII